MRFVVCMLNVCFGKSLWSVSSLDHGEWNKYKSYTRKYQVPDNVHLTLASSSISIILLLLRNLKAIFNVWDRSWNSRRGLVHFHSLLWNSKITSSEEISQPSHHLWSELYHTDFPQSRSTSEPQQLSPHLFTDFLRASQQASRPLFIYFLGHHCKHLDLTFTYLTIINISMPNWKTAESYQRLLAAMVAFQDLKVCSPSWNLTLTLLVPAIMPHLSYSQRFLILALFTSFSVF